MRRHRVLMGCVLLLGAGCGGDLQTVVAGEPPSVKLLVPLDRGQVAASEVVVFSAVVGDDHTPLEALDVAWSWDEEGDQPIAGAMTFVDDVATLVLDEPPAPGSYSVQIQVTDGSGDTSGDSARFELVPIVLPDEDGDGYTDAAAGGTDCNDDDPDVHPDAAEICNGVDDDCDGDIDDGVALTWYPDRDGDGWGDTEAPMEACQQPSGAIALDGDCDDGDASVHPDAAELCNGVDDDCDDDIDEDEAGGGWYADLDGDGYGDPWSPLDACEGAGGSLDGTDCHDDDPSRHWCESCLELSEASGASESGLYTLGTDTVGAYSAWCDLEERGGGWTLVAVNAWTGSWELRTMVDGIPLGSADPTVDYKGVPYSTAPFTDVRFENDEEYAIYEGVGDGTTSWLDFQDSIPVANCGVDTVYEWPMTEGALEGDALCSTNLYINVASHHWLNECAPTEEASWGPTWSAIGYESWGCPLSQPVFSNFASDPVDVNPWGHASPLRMYVR